MSTTANAPIAPIAPSPGDRPAETVPAVPARRSIFPRGSCPAPTATLPAVTLPAAAGADWRGRAVTEELPAVPAPGRRNRRARRLSCRHGVARRHLRAALVGTLLAVVAVTGLSAYAAQGVPDARPTAPFQAHVTRR